MAFFLTLVAAATMFAFTPTAQDGASATPLPTPTPAVIITGGPS